MRKYLLKALKDTMLTWIVLEIGIIVSSFLYAVLSVEGISENTSLLIAFITLVGLIILSLVLIPSYSFSSKPLKQNRVFGQQKQVEATEQSVKSLPEKQDGQKIELDLTPQTSELIQLGPDHSKMKKILIVESHDTTRRHLKLSLEREGYAVYATSFGREVAKIIRLYKVDLILLELILPDSRGLGLGRKLRKSFPNLPIIVVSRITDSDEKVKAFQLFADDYITKPFHIDELLERVRVQFGHIERRHPRSVPRIITVGPLEVNLKQRKVRVNDQPIDLTNEEYELLEVFVQNLNILITYDDLISRLWGDEASPEERRHIHLYINQLRKKIETPTNRRFIYDERKTGYRFQAGDLSLHSS